MSELKTNKISTNDQNNVAIDNALGLKSYTTSQRDALTSVAGDLIYNSDDSKVQVYNGTAWENVGAPSTFDIEYVVVAGGGAGGTDRGGGGGAGGYRSSVSGESSGRGASNEAAFSGEIDTGYTVTVGAGGAQQSLNETRGNPGFNSVFASVTSIGGQGGGYIFGGPVATAGGSGGGAGGPTGSGGSGTLAQGFDGGNGSNSNGDKSGGGGGAGAAGGNASSSVGGAGGIGVQTSISGTATYYAGGGGGGIDGRSSGNPGAGGTGGGGRGGEFTNLSQSGQYPLAGSANTGGGGGGSGVDPTSTAQRGQAGGSGIVLLSYPDIYTATGTGGATVITVDKGNGFKCSTITTSGTVTFSV